MSPWIWGLLAAVLTSIVGWAKFASVKKWLKEISEVLAAFGSFLKEINDAAQDHKITEEEAQQIGIKAVAMYNEFKDVFELFKK